MTQSAFSGHCERFERPCGNLKALLLVFFNSPGSGNPAFSLWITAFAGVTLLVFVFCNRYYLALHFIVLSVAPSNSRGASIKSLAPSNLFGGIAKKGGILVICLVDALAIYNPQIYLEALLKRVVPSNPGLSSSKACLGAVLAEL
jgi:hypothetical protein